MNMLKNIHRLALILGAMACLAGQTPARAADLGADSIDAVITAIDPIRRNTRLYTIEVSIDPELAPYRDVQMILRGAPVATRRMNADGFYEFRVKGTPNNSWAVKVRSLRGRTLAYSAMGKLPAELEPQDEE